MRILSLGLAFLFLTGLAGVREADAQAGPLEEPLLVAQAPSKTAPAQKTEKSAPAAAGKAAVAPGNAGGAVPGQPTITVLLASTKELENDLKFVIVTLGGEPERFKTLWNDMLEVFIDGVDPTKPVAVRSYLVGGNLVHVLSAPITTPADLKKFLANLATLDVKNAVNPPPAAAPANIKKKIAQLGLVKDEYLLYKLFEGVLRYTTGHAHITDDQHLTLLRGINNFPAANLLQGRDLVAIIDNSAQPREERQKAFQVDKEKFLSNVTKGVKEEQADFEIRKAVLEHQMAEVERFFVESLRISLGWTLDTNAKKAAIDLDMVAIAGTSLADSIDSIGKSPDQFAGIEKDKAILSGSINFPIDALRKQHLEANVKLWRPRLKQQVDVNAKRTDAQKNTDHQFVDLIMDVMEGVAKEGVFNGFVRVHPNDSGVYTTLGAARVPDGKKFVTALKDLQDRLDKDKDRVKIDLETVGDVAIHSLAVPDLQPDYPEFLTKDATIYIGTAEKAVWYAAGDQALDRLKAAITSVKPPAGAQDNASAIDLTMKVGPWVELRHKHPLASEDKLSEKDKKMIRDYRKLGIEAMKAGNDTLSLRLDRAGKDVKLQIQFDEGLLRAAGKLMGKAIRDNLE